MSIIFSIFSKTPRVSQLFERAARVLAVTAVVLTGLAFAEDIDDADLSAGTFTIAVFDEKAFSEPIAVLSYKQHQKFMRGRHHFNQRWVVFPGLGGDWGLGPTFITDRCSGCHVGAGRGTTPKSADEQLMAVLVRISIPGLDEHGGPKPHPHYGDQIQNQGLMGQNKNSTFLGERVRQEADVYVDWENVDTSFIDGEMIVLRKPKLRIENLNFGPLGPEVMYSLRLAQPVFGLGLLEAIPESDLLALAEQQKAEGFNGRPNYVWDGLNEKISLGRFGWKANQPSIKQQIAAAFSGDIGVTSSLIENENCPPVQEDCAAQPPGNNPELIDLNWDELVFWTQALAVPARRNVNDADFKRGEKLFAEAKCAVCHVPELKAKKIDALPQTEGQLIRAYTDMLLHDMGEELADHRPEFKASGRDWRTQPLWGIGLSEIVSGPLAMLHDGRARSVAEAILWHGGEATVSREAFRGMPKVDRDALVKFVESL
ncbi:MAG: di-heme oxidoredictase family protein [Pseudomonadales bacterium]